MLIKKINMMQNQKHLLSKLNDRALKIMDISNYFKEIKKPFNVAYLDSVSDDELAKIHKMCGNT